MTLPPGCHVLTVNVPPGDQRRILLRMLRRARRRWWVCRKDIIEVLFEVERKRAEEAIKGAS